MSRVLSSFLIGIGWDTQKLEEGNRKISSSMNSVKSMALTTGAAIAAAALAVGAGVHKNALSIDEMNLKLNKFATSRRDVLGLGIAFQQLGGDAGDAVSEIDRIEQMMANFRIKGETGALGQLAFIPGALTKELLSAKTGMEFYVKLQETAVKLSKDQQRVLQESLGLSDASMKLLTSGNAEFRQRLEYSNRLVYDSTALNENARAYNEQWQTTKTLVGNVVDQLTEKMLPSMTKGLGVVNEFLIKNKDFADGIANLISTSIEGYKLLGKATVNAIKQTDTYKKVEKVVTDLTTHKPPTVMRDSSSTGYAPSSVTDVNKRSGTSYAPPPVVMRDTSGTGYAPSPATDVNKRSGTGYAPSPATDGTGFSPVAMSAAASRAAANDMLASKIGDKVTSTAPTQQPPRIVNEVNVKLDGRLIDQQVTEVNARRTKATLEDLRSTTAR